MKSCPQRVSYQVEADAWLTFMVVMSNGGVLFTCDIINVCARRYWSLQTTSYRSFKFAAQCHCSGVRLASSTSHRHALIEVIELSACRHHYALTEVPYLTLPSRWTGRRTRLHPALMPPH